jgi:hypothetical protein
MEKARWLGSTPDAFWSWGLITAAVTAILVAVIIRNWKNKESPDVKWMCLFVLLCWWTLAILRFYFRYQSFWNTGA